MHTQWVFRGCSHSLIGVNAHYKCSVMLSTHSKVFTCNHKCSEGVQYWLKGNHTYLIVFRACSILTQKHSCAITSTQRVYSSDTNESFAWSHHGELRSLMTRWHSCTLNGYSNSLIAFMCTQWVFPLTHLHSCALNEFSGAVQYSTIGVHTHSMGVQGLFLLNHWHS